MHEHHEVWVPNSVNLKDKIYEIMEGEDYNGPEYYDWLEIGGRWSGVHLPLKKEVREVLEAKYVVGLDRNVNTFKPLSTNLPVDINHAVRTDIFPCNCIDIMPVMSIPDQLKLNCYLWVRDCINYNDCRYVIIATGDEIECDGLCFDGYVKKFLMKLGFNFGYLVTVDAHH